MKERAESIAVAWAMLERLQNDPSDDVGLTFQSLVTRDSYKHANCVRSFLRVYQSDRNLAMAYVDKAVEYLRGAQTNA
jgi:hypothetical protein